MKNIITCSFCYKTSEEVGFMVTGTDMINICEDCVKTCVRIIQERKDAKAEKSLNDAGLAHNPCQGCEAYYTQPGMNRQCVLDCDGNCKWMQIYKTTLEGDADALQDKLHKIKTWTEAYPVSLFPEPDFPKAHEILKQHGMTLDAISASNMRHVLEGIKEIIEND